MNFSHFKRLSKKAIRWLLGLALGFLGLTVVVGLGIFLTLLVAEHNGKLDQWLKEGTGWNIQYQKMHIGISGINPSIVLKNVVLKDPENPSTEFDLQRLEVALSIWSTILERTPVTSQLNITGLHLDVRELANEQWLVNGMTVGAASSGPDLLEGVLKWLLAQKKIVVKNLDVHLVFGNQHDYTFRPVNLTWYGTNHHLNLDTSMVNIPGSKLHLAADFFPGKNLARFAEWKFRFNGSTTANDFSPLLAGYGAYQLKFLSGGGELDFNGLIENGDLQELQMGVSLKNLNLAHKNASSLSIDQMDEEVFWQSFGENNGWSLRIQAVSGAASALGDKGSGVLVVTHHPNDPVNTWMLNANDIDLGVLSQWINFAFTTDTQIAKIWSVLDPMGTVQSLTVSGNTEAGSINFKGTDLSIDATPMFPNGWPDSDLAFASTWQQANNKKNWQVKLTNVDLENTNVRLVVQGNLVVPVADPSNPYLNLTANLQGKNLEEVRDDYIPQNLSKGLVNWLMQGLVKLPKVTANLVWKGKLQDMPYADKAHPGVFHLAVEAQDAQIQPWVNWPLITDIDAKLLFNNQRFTIDAASAKTQDVALNQVHFELSDMRPHSGQAILITGSATPTGAQALNYIASMPIVSATVQNALKNNFQLGGVVPVNLMVKIPVHRALPATLSVSTNANATNTTNAAPLALPSALDAPVIVTGTATFKGNNLNRLVDQQNQLWFKNINGLINFENQYLSSNNLAFVFKDLPCNVQIIKSPVNNLHALIPEAQLYGQSFKNVNVYIQAAPSNTKAPIKNPLVTFMFNDMNAVGKVILQPDGSILGQLDKWMLVIPKPDAPIVIGTSPNAKTPASTVKVDTAKAMPVDYLNHLGKLLAQIPALDLTVKSFAYGANNLGALMLESNPMSDGIEIQHMTLGNDDITLDLAGSIVTHNNQDEISLSGNLSGNDFGAALTQLGYPGIVDSGSGSIKFDLNWFGALFHPEWSTLQGDFVFNVSNGKFLKVNTGLAQVLGLLSLNTVVSTFSLDFKGIFSGGLAFSSIQGTYNIHNGIAHTEDLKISGPTVNVQVRGDLDLVNRTIDQLLVIQPQVGTSVALAATVLGGPIAGAATFVANELLNRTVFKNTGFSYRITGSLDKPVATSVPVEAEPLKSN